MIWYDKPAAFLKGHGSQTLINEGLAIGNGHIGALIQGEPAGELLRLNQDSLWTGSSTVEGSYQALADLSISLPDHASATAYRRDLDLSQALSHVSYQANGIQFNREFFASHPANVLVVHLTANQPGGFTGTISLKDQHDAKVVADNARLTAAGALPDNGTLRYGSKSAKFNLLSGQSIPLDGALSPLFR
jgi:alpha-L-fucosidase 2